MAPVNRQPQIIDRKSFAQPTLDQLPLLRDAGRVAKCPRVKCAIVGKHLLHLAVHNRHLARQRLVVADYLFPRSLSGFQLLHPSKEIGDRLLQQRQAGLAHEFTTFRNPSGNNRTSFIRTTGISVVSFLAA